MTPELEVLARRVVACKGWRWMPGMLALRTAHPVVVERGAPSLIPVRLMGCITDHEEVAGITLHGELLEAGHVVVNGWHRSSDLIPDLSDPVTCAALLLLVREAWGDPRLAAIYCEAANPGQSEGWAVQCADNRLPVAGEDYPSEAEALLAALEAAPCP